MNKYAYTQLIAMMFAVCLLFTIIIMILLHRLYKVERDRRDRVEVNQSTGGLRHGEGYVITIVPNRDKVTIITSNEAKPLVEYLVTKAHKMKDFVDD